MYYTIKLYGMIVLGFKSSGNILAQNIWSNHGLPLELIHHKFACIEVCVTLYNFVKVTIKRMCA